MDHEELLKRLFERTSITLEGFSRTVQHFLDVAETEGHTYCPLQNALELPKIWCVEQAAYEKRVCCVFCEKYFPEFRRSLGLDECWCPCSCLGVDKVVDIAKELLTELELIEKEN